MVFINHSVTFLINWYIYEGVLGRYLVLRIQIWSDPDPDRKSYRYPDPVLTGYNTGTESNIFKN